MRASKSVLLLGLIVAAAVPGGCSDSDSVQFTGYDHQAFEAARSAGKPILIYGTADW